MSNYINGLVYTGISDRFNYHSNNSEAGWAATTDGVSRRIGLYETREFSTYSNLQPDRTDTSFRDGVEQKAAKVWLSPPITARRDPVSTAKTRTRGTSLFLKATKDDRLALKELPTSEIPLPTPRRSSLETDL